jgi:hypothetical protein
MKAELIEYIRKNGRNKGRKKGVLFCGIDPSNSQKAVVGFTLCNNIDRFDYINDKPAKGFGLETAKSRAEKWANHTDFFVQNSFTEKMIEDEDFTLLVFINPDKQKIVEIPPSVVGKMKIFLERCRRYYKDKVFPEWIEKFEKGDEYPKECLKVEAIQNCYYDYNF